MKYPAQSPADRMLVMNEILEGLRYATLEAAGFAVAAIVNPGNVNAEQLLREERVLINCEQGKVPREAIWTSNRPTGATLLLGQLDWISLGDGEWKINGYLVAVDSLNLHDLPNSKEIYMLDSHTIIFRYSNASHKLRFSPGVPEMPGEQATTLVTGESKCIDVK
jgi:hypothetical protein